MRAIESVVGVVLCHIDIHTAIAAPCAGVTGSSDVLLQFCALYPGVTCIHTGSSYVVFFARTEKRLQTACSLSASLLVIFLRGAVRPERREEGREAIRLIRQL